MPTCCGAPIDKEKLLGDTLRPDGTVTVTCTLPENPFIPLTETCAGCVSPCASTTVAGCADKEKSG